MNILIVYPQPEEKKLFRFSFSYDMVLLATILESKHKVSIHDYSYEPYYEENFKQELINFKYDLVIVECDSFSLRRSQNLSHARHILSLVNNYVPTIAFGHYCCIKNSDFYPADFTIKVNDINPILEIINDLSNGMAVSPIKEYDDLPHIDRKLLLQIPYFKTHSNSTLLQTSQGCKNTCIFCQRKGWNKKYIAHSDSYVLQELEELSRDNFSNVWIIDENFTFDLNRAKRILTTYSSISLSNKPNLFISSWTNIDREFVDLAVECNIKIISFGIETGNPEILKFYRKNINLETIPEIIRYANSKGIFTVGNFIIGAPMETLTTIEETFSFIHKCQLDSVNIKTLDYMIGSALYNTLPENLKEFDHVFACEENQLCNFPLNFLLQKKYEFLKSYYTSRKENLRQKILRYGFPYQI